MIQISRFARNWSVVREATTARKLVFCMNPSLLWGNCKVIDTRMTRIEADGNGLNFTKLLLRARSLFILLKARCHSERSEETCILYESFAPLRKLVSNRYTDDADWGGWPQNLKRLKPLNVLNDIQFPRFTRNDRVYDINDSDFSLRSKLKRKWRCSEGITYIPRRISTLDERVAYLIEL